MSNERAFGMFCGIATGIVLVILIMRILRGKKGLGEEFDEMQTAARGRAYMYAYAAMMLYEAAMFLLRLFEVKLPLDGPAVHIIAVFLGLLVQVSYCVWHNAYFGLNTDKKRFGIIFVLASLCNRRPVIRVLVDGSMFGQGEMAPQFVNLLCVLVFAILGIELLLKAAVDRREEA